MLKPEQIPQEAAKAFRSAFVNPDVSDQELIAAAINAWPGVDAIMLPRMIKPGHFMPQNYIRLPAPPAPR